MVGSSVQKIRESGAAFDIAAPASLTCRSCRGCSQLEGAAGIFKRHHRGFRLNVFAAQCFPGNIPPERGGEYPSTVNQSRRV